MSFYDDNRTALWLVTIALLILLSIDISHGYCYQETANISTVCGGLNTGAYGEYNPNSRFFPAYIYINYTIPYNATNNSVWQIEHGWDNITLTPLLYNITFNNTSCQFIPNQTLQLRFYTTTYNGLAYIVLRDGFSHPECYNGTSWIIIGNTSSTYGICGGSCNQPYTSMSFLSYDENWNTSSFYSNYEFTLKFTECFCYGESGGAFIYEEGMFWDMENISNMSNETNCTELWINNNTICNGYNYTIQYFDYYSCNTTYNLPVDNGTIVPCTINVSSCADNLCINPISANVSCCIVTPVITCTSYTYELYDNEAVLLSSGTMLPFVNDTYFYMFNRDVGTYYTKICDDSTRQLIVEGDNMIGLTGQTWFLIMIILLFILFLWLSIRVDILFLILDGIIFVYLAYYSYTLFSSWFITVMCGLVGLLFMLFGVMGKIHETTKG